MSIHYVIDGYNIIKHRLFKEKDNLNESRIALASLIEDKRLCGGEKNKVTIVFDGSSAKFCAKSPAYCEFIFTENESADQRIKRLVADANNPKEITVVSDDKEIIFFIVALGAKPLGVDEFLGKEEKKFPKAREESSERKLTYTEMSKINAELKKLWLK